MEITEILIVDDDLERRDAFRRALGKMPGVYLFFADNPEDGIRMIRARAYDLIFLDHDLADMHMTGWDVACCLYGTVNYHSYVWVHSWNPEGAKRMDEVLGRLGIKSHVEAFQDTEFFWNGVTTLIRPDSNAVQQATG